MSESKISDKVVPLIALAIYVAIVVVLEVHHEPWRDEADPVDMRCAGFQTILIRATQWLAQRPVTWPVRKTSA